MERKLTAILSTDVEGYSRLMGDDEEATVRTLTEYREVVGSLIDRHRGRVIDSPGDNLLAQFASAVDAVECAVAIQKDLRRRNASYVENRRMNFRIGVNLGDVIVEGDRIYGDGVNVAARMESLAEGGGICVSSTVYDHVENKLSYAFNFLGEQSVKNIKKPVRVYQVHWDVEKATTGKDKSSKRWVWTAAVVAVVAALAFIVWRQVYEELKSLPQTEIPSIAVLPFLDMSPEKDQEYFCEGISEELINAFTKVEGLRVAARTSSFRLKGSDIFTIGEQLNVTTVLEGSVRKAGNNLRITAQLINVADGFQLWSEIYDKDMKNIFAIQNEISQAIAKALNVALMGEEGSPLVKASTENVAAYDFYLKGRFFWNQRGEGLSKSIEYYEQAIKEDPNFALAYTGLGDTYSLLGHYNYLPINQALPKAKQALLKALELEPNLAEAHAALGYVLNFDWDWNSVERELKRSIQLNPNLNYPHIWYGSYLSRMGRFEEGNREFDHALEIDPLYFLVHDVYGRILFHQRQFHKAEEHLKTAIELKPDFPTSYFNLGRLLIHQKRYEEGMAVYVKAMSLVAKDHKVYGRVGLSLGWAYAMSGDRERAKEILSDLKEKAKSEYVSPMEIGFVYLGLDEVDNAFTWFTRSVEAHDYATWPLIQDPIFDPIRSDPRYAELLRKMGLEK